MSPSNKSTQPVVSANGAAKKTANQPVKAPAKPAAPSSSKPQPKGVPVKSAAQNPKASSKPAPPKTSPFKASVQPASKPAAPLSSKPQPKSVPIKPAAQPAARPQPQKPQLKSATDALGKSKPTAAVTNSAVSSSSSSVSAKSVNKSSQASPQQRPLPAQQVKTPVAAPEPSHAADFSSETLAILFKAAKKASEHAYAPYSRFKVGAVLLLEDGSVEASQISAYTGCNVENASYGLTCCAERIAVYKAISDGNKKFKALILYASAKKPVSPCGACRQVLAEFAPADMKIYSIGHFKDEDVSKTPYTIYTVSELLPHGFKASDFIEKK